MDLAFSLAELWKHALGLDAVNPDDNFFALGGDSISAMILLARVEEVLGVMPDPGLIYDHPVFQDMAQVLADEIAAGSPVEAEGLVG